MFEFRFDAPRPYTKVTKPVRRVQRDGTCRVSWNTAWVFADDRQVRQRLDKRSGYGPWRAVSVADGERTKVVNKGRGKTWCYAAKGMLGEQTVTRWSKQRCVTVRR